MGDKKTYTDAEFRRLRKQLNEYIRQSKEDERMWYQREKWLWLRPGCQPKHKRKTKKK